MMNYCKYLFIFVFVFFSGCAHYQTNIDSSDFSLRPRVLKGPINEIQSVAYEAAKKAFPDETGNIKIDSNNKIVILREWFWRGDTIITISIEEPQTNECVINAESKASHHRLNATLSFDVARKEMVYYLSVLDEEYKLYLKNKNTVINSNTKTLEDKLTEIKEAFEKGLITESEYKAKRKEIIDTH